MWLSSVAVGRGYGLEPGEIMAVRGKLKQLLMTRVHDARCDSVKAVETGPEKGIVLFNHEPQMCAYKLATDRTLSHNGRRNVL